MPLFYCMEKTPHTADYRWLKLCFGQVFFAAAEKAVCNINTRPGNGARSMATRPKVDFCQARMPASPSSQACLSRQCQKPVSCRGPKRTGMLAHLFLLPPIIDEALSYEPGVVVVQVPLARRDEKARYDIICRSPLLQYSALSTLPSRHRPFCHCHCHRHPLSHPLLLLISRLLLSAPGGPRHDDPWSARPRH